MWCINLTTLFMGILWILTIFNFIAIFIIVCFAVPGWNKTANKIFRYRYMGDYSENEIDNINKRIKDIYKELDKK